MKILIQSTAAGATEATPSHQGQYLKVYEATGLSAADSFLLMSSCDVLVCDDDYDDGEELSEVVKVTAREEFDHGVAFALGKRILNVSEGAEAAVYPSVQAALDSLEVPLVTAPR